MWGCCWKQKDDLFTEINDFFTNLTIVRVSVTAKCSVLVLSVITARGPQDFVRVCQDGVRTASGLRQDVFRMASEMVHVCVTKRQGSVWMASG